MFALGNFTCEINIVGALFVHALNYEMLVYLFEHRPLIRDAPDDVGSGHLRFDIKVLSIVVEMLVGQELLDRALLQVELFRD